DCHSKILANQIIHAPAEESCDYCHESNGKDHPLENVKGFTLSEKMPGLCYICHEDIERKYTHAPVEGGECVVCHSPHSSSNSGLLLTIPVANLCFECHDTEITENKINHQPVSEGNCQSCHDPHKSNERSLLKSEMPGLCFSCHEKSGQEMTAKHIHPPFEDDCRNCHAVHGSSEKNLIDQTGIDLCYNCHDDVKESIGKHQIVHKAVNEKSACMNCHSPHASLQKKFLVAESKELCLQCHNKSIATETRKLSNIKKKLTKSKVVHGAIEFDGCSGCHFSHSSMFPSLLEEAFPAGNYTPSQPDSFALCFLCHDSELIKAKITKTGTNFRNDDQNLHYVHISGDKGRSCKNCHDMHGSQSEHLIASKVVFGKWEMPIIFEVVENGGSCLTGCHSKKKYDRNKFIFNSISNNEVEVEKIEKYVEEQLISIDDNTEESKLVVSTKSIEYKKLLVEFEKIQLPSIRFELRETIIVEETKKELINVINFMKEFPESKILIEGYTDGVDEKTFDITLSMKRAERIKRIMVSFGISKERITTIGLGRANPVASNNTNKGREMNRRVEFILVE
ncbi:MAG: OmpA family protein, partial [Planctomycetes bacterium]|nr:OmpA family protein [Planctomycetota bacterium]